MKNLLALLIFSLLYTSCAPGPGTSNLKVSVAAVTGSANFPGGLFFMGKNLDSQESFSLRVLSDNDTLEIELPNGKYNFYAIGWGSDSGNYEGNIYCDVQNSVALEGGEFPIQMNASTTTCQQPLFNNNSVAGMNELKVQSCGGIKKHIDNGRDIIGMSLSCSNSGQLYAGGDLGFELSVAEFGLGQVPKANFYSACRPTDGSSSGFKIPFGLLNELTIPVAFRSYSDAGCNTLSKGYIFEKGLNSNAFNNLAMADYTNGNVYLHRDLCNHIHQDGALGAYKRDTNRVTLVCSQSQLEGVNGSNVYEIGKNITVSGFSTISSFSGQLSGAEDAGNIVIEGLDAPLFGTISTTSGEETRITDLIFKNSTLTPSFSADDNYGILAKEINGATYNSQKIVLRNLYFTNTNSITPTFSSSPNVMIGILAGHASFYVGSESLIVENVHSRASILGNFSGAGSATYTGGFFGKVYGGSGGSIHIENSSVGTIYDGDWEDTSKHVQINGQNYTGGMIGFAMGQSNDNRIYIRHSAANVMSQTRGSYYGGLIGWAKYHVVLEDTYSHLKAEPTVSSQKLGGVIGGVDAFYTKPIILKGVIGKITLKSLTQANYVGGVIGGVTAYDYSNDYYLKMMRTTGIVDIENNGSYYGGLIGYFSNLNGYVSYSSDPEVCVGCYVKGKMKQYSSNAVNIARGGLFGRAINAKVKYVIVDMDIIEGYSQIAAGIGQSQQGIIHQAYLSVDSIDVDHTDPFVGFIAGKDIIGSLQNYHKIIVDGMINVQNSVDCLAVDPGRLGDSCGILYGGATATHTPASDDYAYIINLGDINTGKEECGEGGCRASYMMTNPAELTTDCSGVGSDADFEFRNGSCGLKFANSWKEFSSSEIHYGNFMDPLLITSPARWNEVGASKFLSLMSFTLTKDITLGSSFVPFGSNYDFQGQLFGDGYSISKSSGAWSASTGLIKGMVDAQIGEPGIPLIVEGFDFNCISANCGIIQTAEGEARLSIQAKNINISSSPHAGGLIGVLDGTELKISTSSFNGTVDSSLNYAGGFVGKVFNNDSKDIHIDIKDSFVVSNRIVGRNGTGGFLGYISGSTGDSLNIDSSFYISQLNVTDQNLEDTNSVPGLIVGNASSTRININHSFFDITNMGGANDAHEVGIYSNLSDNNTYVIDRNTDFVNKLSNRPVSVIFDDHTGNPIELYNELGGSWVIENDRMKLWWML